jgi:hypothetical protein
MRSNPTIDRLPSAWTLALLFSGLCSLLGAVAGGCTGEVEGTAGAKGGDPTDQDGDGIPDAVPSSLTQCKDLGTIDVAPAAMRRLNQSEYDNTLHDLGLVPADVNPGAELAGDLSIGAGQDRGFAVGGPVDDTLALDLVNSAISIAGAATANLSALTGCSPSGTTEQNNCASSFITRMGQRVFRRPLTADESNELLALYKDTRNDFDHRAGIEAVVAAMLTAPDFIYLFEAEPTDAADGDVVALDDWAAASRLSYFLWDSTPDETLLEAAAAGELRTPEQLQAQAVRMLADPRAKRAVASFFSQWAVTRKLDGLTKDDAAFTEEVSSALRASIDQTFEDAFFGDDGTLENLFGSTNAFVSDAIAPLFGAEAGMGDAPVPTAVDGAQRRGVLTHPALLAVYAKPDRGDPIHRGLFVREKLLCMDLPEPPAMDADGNPINLVVPPAEPGQSDRDRFAAHTERIECSGCHKLVDPLGFGFENYDALGRYRTENQFGEAIDSTGEVLAGGDLEGEFHGGVELAEKVASSDTVADCMAIQWFRFALDRKEVAEHDACSTATALKGFVDGERTIKDLVLGIVQSAGFRHRRVGGVTP